MLHLQKTEVVQF